MEAGTSEVEIPETSNVDLAKDEPKEREPPMKTPRVEAASSLPEKSPFYILMI